MNTRTISVHFSSLHLKLFMAACVCALALVAVPVQARAAGLTEAQINAVIGLLSAFEVPQETINNVDAILHGQSEGKVSSSTQPTPAVDQPSDNDNESHEDLNEVEDEGDDDSSHTPGVSRSGFEAPSMAASAALVPILTTTDSLNLVADQIMEVNHALAYVLSSYIALFSFDYVPQAAAAATAAPAGPSVAGESLAATLAYLPESLYETAGKTTDFLAAVEMAPVYVITDALSSALFKAGIY